MAPTMLPFLYQTRTLQRLVRITPRRAFSQSVRLSNRRREPSHDSIPFEGPLEGIAEAEDAAENPSTMTPSEAEVFKSIFDDISGGKLPASKFPRNRAQQPGATDSPFALPTSGSIVDQARQARLTDFRDHVLQRYPESLREAAQKALNLYAFNPAKEPNGPSLLEQAEESVKLRQERLLCESKRKEEEERLEQLMKSCDTDVQLWELLQSSVFTIPAKLGIVEGKQSAIETKQNSSEEELSFEERYSMDIYGPLYAQCLLSALKLFDAAWSQPSPYAFSILPKVKEIGLSSYVLGASTSFYGYLARMHWDRYGDALAALDMIEEMNSIGLQPDVEIHDLLVRIRDELQECAAGSQGPFVAAMMESPPYDAATVQKVEDMETYARRSLLESRGEYTA
ncbi:hypothetical protein LIA77_03626 [Sarocladium implicatum]|nr:hypothetical protein LIA77_03626 [Sarocladium implicatum]